MELYDHKKWKEKREHIMRRDKYQCQWSKRYGKLVQAEIVHHVFPVSEFPEYAFDDWNLIAVSKRVHNMLHDRDTNELTEAGRELLIRTARKYFKPIPEKYRQQVRQRRGNGRPHTI